MKEQSSKTLPFTLAAICVITHFLVVSSAPPSQDEIDRTRSKIFKEGRANFGRERKIANRINNLLRQTGPRASPGTDGSATPGSSRRRNPLFYKLKIDAFGQVADLKGGDLTSKLLDNIGKMGVKMYKEFLKKGFKVEDLRGISSLDFTPEDRQQETGSGPMYVPTDPSQCPVSTSINCPPKTRRQRTFDGSCNNLANPTWGKSNMPFVRLLPTNYGDGGGSLRRARSGAELPSARLVSKDIHNDQSNPSLITTMNHMTFGQFLDHDLDRAPVAKMETDDGTLVDVVCGDDGCDSGTEPDLKDCAPIPVPPNDPIFGNKTCVKFVRSSAAPMENCMIGPRRQTNQITGPLDASLVYGNDAKDAEKLRDPDTNRGKLLLEANPRVPPSLANKFKPLLPRTDVAACRDVDDVIKCFDAGDKRLNEHIGLTVHHLYWAREHNRIEQKLHDLNPHWNGERLYQTARKILIAEWQFIVYNEYLPTVLGEDIMNAYRLWPYNRYNRGYDKTLNPGVSNSFATAAFRFGHSQVGNKLKRSAANHSTIQDHFFTSVFRRPELIYRFEENGPDSIALGMTNQEGESVDRHMAVEVNGRMFTDNPPFGFGTDLAALNVQRGRDHGITGYNAWRYICGGNLADSFDDFKKPRFARPGPFDLSNTAVQKLKDIYEHPDDVDLFTAGLMEKNLPGALVGPTFACLIADQFVRSKRGDRFWFENKRSRRNGPYAGPWFTRAQINAIRKTSLARIFCDNSDDGIQTIQPLPMVLPYSDAVRSQSFRYSHGYQYLSFYKFELGKRHPLIRSSWKNERVRCDDTRALPELDLSLWKDRPRRVAPRDRRN